MADSKVSALTAQTSPLGTDEVYLARSSDSTEYRLALAALLGSGGAWVNLVKNSPGQIVTDAVEPQWWDDVANAAITDEDCAGEAIPDKTERCFKVATTANDVYGYQTYTFADESLLDAGQTVVSASCWVYCASASKASVGLYGTNMGLTESSQHPGDSTWRLLTVENKALNAADTSIQLRLLVDTGTAYFIMPMLNLGSMALPWRPRETIFVPIATALQYSAVSGDIAWSDTDCTANTHPLAVGIEGTMYIKENDGTAGSSIAVSHSNAVMGSDNYFAHTQCVVINQVNRGTYPRLACDDSQTVRYTVSEADADSDVDARVYITGYWRWEP